MSEGHGVIAQYWSVPPAEVAARLAASEAGLTSGEAARRLQEYGPNELKRQAGLSRLRVLWNQLGSPLLLLLLFAAAASLFSGQWVDASIVLVIVVASVGLGYTREYRAERAVAEMRARVHVRATVLRDGAPVAVPVREVVPGDVFMVSAGSLVPADGVILSATDFFVNQAMLTGESFPVEKRPGPSPAAAGLTERSGSVFLGTNVRSGTARCLAVDTGPATQFGSIAHRLMLRPPETEFDRGLRRFGYLLSTAMLVMVLAVFAANMLLGRPPIETLLFAIALAVGLSPELLPAILSINLARGSQMMGKHGVLVRRLPAIENLGSMDVLCTDKTGTLTEGVVRLEGAYDATGAKADEVLALGAINASLETGLPSPLDDAILQAWTPDLSGLRKEAEIPFDFVRKRVSVIVEGPDGLRLVAKGAFHHVLQACSKLPDGTPLGAEQRGALERRHDEWSGRGIRVLAVAVRSMPAPQDVYRREDEHDLTFVGFLTFLDRPKEGV